MKLINADELLNKIQIMLMDMGWWNVGRIEQIIRNMPTAQSEQRWIPCSEKMPEYDKPVLLSTAWVKTEIGFWTQRGWMIVACSYREFEQDAVAAWMPLPEPYREGEQDETL
jgi:hypothetical protein